MRAKSSLFGCRPCVRMTGLLLPVWLLVASAGAMAASTGGEVTLTDGQMKFISVVRVGQADFADEREAVGNTDYDQDRTVQVSSPYAGRVVSVSVSAGDDVHKGQVLFSIDSPDLVQAESALLSSAGTLHLTDAALQRARELYAVQGMAQKDYEQAVSDQQTAEAAYRSATDALRIFGKSDAQIRQIVASRHIDSVMPVLSPISGQVVARNAAPGLLVQPGATPAPFTVSDLSRKWLVASVAESDLPLVHVGQAVDVRLMAYPDEVFHGRVDYVASSVDPNTHRVAVRSTVQDPRHRIAAQMMATFILHAGRSTLATAVPVNGVVREGDGSMTVWVTTDRRHFYRRHVQLGMQQHGMDQILAGLKPGELIAGDGALFISNAWVLGLR